MRVGISHIAWDAAEDETIAAVLKRHRIDAIDIAPTTYFADPGRASSEDLRRVREAWAGRGIEITGMQALLFGAHGLNLFAPAAVQDAMLARLTDACRIGGAIGAKRLVFGSPRNRDRGALGDEQVMDMALAFFRRLGDIAGSHGVVVCLEPNPPRYGANFMTTAEQTAAVVRRVAHPAIRMQFDTGALAINGEDPEQVLASHANLVGHVHASEPELVPLGDGATPHAAMAAGLRRHLPSHLVTIEMVAARNEPHANAIDRAVRVALEHYGDESGGAR